MCPFSGVGLVSGWLDASSYLALPPNWTIAVSLFHRIWHRDCVSMRFDIPKFYFLPF
jgi:hypothetical protein